MLTRHDRHPGRPRFEIASCGLALALAVLVTPASADRPLRADQTPYEMEGVGITERLGETVPLDLVFADESGEPVKIGDFFSADKPVILTLNYFRCPQLCTLELNGLLDALNDIDWTIGEEFRIVTVSIAPDETHELADVKKRAYLSRYDRETDGDGWHFLTGRQESIAPLASAVGYGYRKDEKKGDYAHSASIMFITSDGRISRYINDVVFDPKDVRLALVEASDGAIGSPMEKFLLFTCYQFDPEAGSYAMSAIKMMRLAGAMTLVLIVLGIFMLRRRGPKGGASGGPRRDPRRGPGLGPDEIELGGLQS